MIQAGATVPNLTTPAAAMGLGLFYGGLILLIAGYLEFRVGNNFYALTFCSYAGYWLSLAALYVNGSFMFSSAYTDATVFAKALGIFYIGWVIFTLAMLIASIRTNAVLVAFFFFLMLTYVLWAAGYFLTTSSNLLVAGGAIGIFTSVIAWFLGFASLLRRGHNSYFNLPNYSLAPKTGAADSLEAPVERRKL
jgi:succinate-acetate transporter protein